MSQARRIYFNGLPVWLPIKPRWRKAAVWLKYNPARALVRRQTEPYRVLPNALILGAQKGGSTSLFYYLAQHPNVFPALFKEVQFFHQPFFVRGESWYRSFFPLQSAIGAEAAVLEGTPTYLFDPHAAARAAATLPNARLLVLLRNPAQRAYSHYHHMRRAGVEKRPFLHAISSEIDAYSDAYQQMVSDSICYDRDLMRFSYLRGGHYAEMLQRWLDYFPRHQLLILNSETFYANVAQTLQRVHQFLGLPSEAISTVQPKKKYHHAQNPPMNPDAQAFLQAHFADKNDELFDLLGTTYAW